MKFLGDVDGLSQGISIILSDLDYLQSKDEIVIQVENRPGKLEIHYCNKRGFIRYDKKAHFFRGLGLFVQHLKENRDFNISEESQFELCGPMFDYSRNAVMKLDTVKLFLRKLALMGLNCAMMYMEDTYEIKGEPYFGYMRGRYTYDELKELDDYAFSLGIELIPCIQTLAHLEEFLKWEAAAEYRDTRGVLLADNEKTYELIEKMIVSASAPFRTKRIHIGMDEANELGRGRFLNEYGYKSRFDIMLEHLEKVYDIVRKHDLTPMIWSDMFLRLASATGEDYYGNDTKIPEHVIAKTPKEVQMVYWDYYTKKVEDYKNLITKHKAFGKAPVFTGGIWVWNSIGTNYGLSLLTAESALIACKEEGVKEVFVSLWGDDGNENNVFSALLGLQYYAEHSFSKVLDKDKLKERLKFCTGIDYNSFMLLNALDETPGCNPDNTMASNPSKFLLWQDTLIGLFDKHIEGLSLNEHYKNLGEEIGSLRDPKRQLDFIFDVPEKLCRVLALKSEVGIKTKEAYDKGDREELIKIAKEMLPEISERVLELRDTHRNQWFSLNKPFGWEVLDIRYGGVLTRIDTAIGRLNDYLGGKINRIEELEEERLFYSKHNRFVEGHGTGWCCYYYRIASPNVFFHVLPLY